MGRTGYPACDSAPEPLAIGPLLQVLIRSILRLRKQDHAERQEQEAILDLYMSALGMAA